MQETAESAHRQWEQVAIGNFFNDSALVRLVGALMLEQIDELAVSRCDMTLETIGSVSRNPIVSLLALAARSEPDPALGR